MTVEGQVQGCCLYPISSAGDKDSWSANSRNRTATVISICMKCNKASTYEMQKMFTHLFHVSWGQCVFSTVMNGKLLINWCNHHTKKRKKQMGIQTKCLQQNRWDLLSYSGKIFCLFARARITLFNITPNNQPQHLQHQLSFSENTINYVESWNPLKNIFEELC